MNSIESTKAINELVSRDDWDLFVTITFFKPTSFQNAKKRFKYFFKKLNTKKEQYYKKFIKTWLFFERDNYRNGVHIHALVSGISPQSASSLGKKCRREFGQSKVLPYAPSKDVGFYLGFKYSTKRLKDFDFCKINSRLRIRKEGKNEKSRHLCKSKHSGSILRAANRKAKGFLQEC